MRKRYTQKQIGKNPSYEEKIQSLEKVHGKSSTKKSKKPRGKISKGLKDHRRSVKKDLYPQNRLTTKGKEGYSKSECIEERTKQ